MLKGKGLKAKGNRLTDENPSKDEIISNLKKGFKEMQLFKKNKLKTISLNDFLNEL